MCVVCYCIDERTVLALEKLRVSAEDFEIKNTIGRGHFGEVNSKRERLG